MDFLPDQGLESRLAVEQKLFTDTRELVSPRPGYIQSIGTHLPAVEQAHELSSV